MNASCSQENIPHKFGERCNSFNSKGHKVESLKKSYSFKEKYINSSTSVNKCEHLLSTKRPNIPPPPPPNVKPKSFDYTCETRFNPTNYNVSSSSSGLYKDNINPTGNLNHMILKFEKNSNLHETSKYSAPKKLAISHKSRHIQDLIDRGRFESLDPHRIKTGITRGFFRLQGEQLSPECEKKKNGFLKSIRQSFNVLKQSTLSVPGKTIKTGPKLSVLDRTVVQDKPGPKLSVNGRADFKTKDETNYNLAVSRSSQIKETLNKNKDGLVVMSPELLYSLLTPLEEESGFRKDSEKLNCVHRYAPTAPPLDSI